MSSSYPSSTSSTQKAGQPANASASAASAPQKTTLVSGEKGDSVDVQSQLATSQVAGDVKSNSNIGQVVSDLGTAHDSSSQWLEQETAKVNDWGQKEIQRVLQQTKSMEEALVAGAKEKQKTLDASHSGEIAKLVQQMDQRKAAELKELEDGLQRQIQATLTSSKNEINRVESAMNAKKMELLKQSQLKSAKEVDTLSNLVVETKLTPSQTRTVIDTNTNTGNVIAVATGGNISTGSAQAETLSSQQIAAVPNAGELRQGSDVTRGDMIQDATGRKVGEGAIVNTKTQVTEQQGLEAGQKGNDVTVRARPLQHDQQQPSSSHSGKSGLLSSSELQQHAATHPPVDRSGVAGHDGTMPEKAVVNPQPMHKDVGHQDAALMAQQGKVDAPMHSEGAGVAGGAPAEHHSHGLLCKVKHALGMESDSSKHHSVHGQAGEPRSSDAARRV